jgi:hypothetical protein
MSKCSPTMQLARASRKAAGCVLKSGRATLSRRSGTMWTWQCGKQMLRLYCRFSFHPGCLFWKGRSFDSILDIWCLFDWHGHYSLRHANTTRARKQGKKHGTKRLKVKRARDRSHGARITCVLIENSDGKRAESWLRSLCVQNFSAISYSMVYFSSKILSCAIREKDHLYCFKFPHACSLCLDGFLLLRIKPS